MTDAEGNEFPSEWFSGDHWHIDIRPGMTYLSLSCGDYCENTAYLSEEEATRLAKGLIAAAGIRGREDVV